MNQSAENDAPLCCDTPCWRFACEGTGDSVTPPGELCSTCAGQGSVLWMHESDPNLYQEPDADGRVPCSDCVIPPAKD